MQNRFVLVVLAVALVFAGCTTTDGAPATAPSTSSAPPMTVATTSTTSTSTTVAPQTTTTLDRLAEIQAIFEDLEQRRLLAILDQDEEAFRGLYANGAYLEFESEAFDAVDVLEPSNLSLTVVSVENDDETCIAASVHVDATKSFEGGSAYDTTIVLETLGTNWGYSWVGEGWQCDGPHPLSG